MHDGQTLAMSDGAKATFHVKDGKVMVDDANIIAAIPAMNGMVYVVDACCCRLPSSKSRQ